MSKENKILTREEVDVNLTWDLTHIFKNDEEFKKAQGKLIEELNGFIKKYKGNIKTSDDVVKSVKEYEEISELLSKCGHYVDLYMASDRTNPTYQKNDAEFSSSTQMVLGEMSFYQSDLLKLEEKVLDEAVKKDESLKWFIEDLKKQKKHMLSDDVEKVLSTYSEIMGTPYTIYGTAKLADMKFEPFMANGKEYPLSFNNFEGSYEYEADTEVRRNAFRAFSDKLEDYKYTIGTAYYMQLRKEKITSQLRNYDSVFDYLLERQKVTRDLYDRQLDVIMEELAPHMRKYAKLIKKIHKLDNLKFEDLKLDIDPSFEPTISVEDSKEYIYGALDILGEDYSKMLHEALDNRWLDYVQNKGKSTGGFCTTARGVHTYILLNWTNKMREVFVQAHELGHAGHSYLTDKNQRLINGNLSMYAIEAPSTMNEMLMGNYLMSKADSTRYKRWVVSSIIARTYFHNFVTHFLEGYYQREVYKAIDNGESLSPDDFSKIYLQTVKKFWGEDIEMTKGAELTWMRQPHYYMGLYPYTYSAGLTIATAVSLRIQKEGQKAVDDWRKCLSAGGTVTPVEFAKLAGVDITTDKPLKDTIAHIGSLIDEIYTLTEKLEKEEK